MEKIATRGLVFINKNYVKRDYESTNIVACETVGNTWPSKEFVYADESILDNLTPLYIENGIRYYGHI